MPHDILSLKHLLDLLLKFLSCYLYCVPTNTYLNLFNILPIRKFLVYFEKTHYFLCSSSDIMTSTCTDIELFLKLLYCLLRFLFLLIMHSFLSFWKISCLWFSYWFVGVHYSLWMVFVIYTVHLYVHIHILLLTLFMVSFIVKKLYL